ncbi:LysR family transcriptional regulator [Actibacterium sp. XHP0104]|uniref:LysR family transcriptional regulator n=1 Tax=Actibacterium sp. XHP0104 TaxID=2984335 RepID=UPI0021E707E0|nr:LysR family transcriptional regulator [Actibacterium sp. XHP0104]MCV2881039.1 LysR family transcriptional regulator [Actibacterium sp. XHP0104]
MHSDNWDDLRFVLAVAETGTVSGAARQLGVNHATVLRRVAAFEDRHGAPVFERTAQGYVIRADRLRVIEAAREVKLAVEAVGRRIRGMSEPLMGEVRVTSTDTFCHAVLPPVMGRVLRREQGCHLTLLCTNAQLDLSRLHADLTVRPAQELADGLSGDIVGHLGFAVYATPGADDRWLGLTGGPGRTRIGQWQRDQLGGDDPVACADSFLVLRELLAQGLGRGVLPCVLADGDARLERVGEVDSGAAVPIWVACHSDMIAVPRIARARGLLAEELARDSARLLGQ